MIFKKNIEALRKSQPELADIISAFEPNTDLEVLPSKKGEPSARFHQVSLHSLYDPVSEAKNWLDHYRDQIEDVTTVSVLGFGLAYHLAELSGCFHGKITVYEPSLDLLCTAFRTRDLTGIIKAIRIETGFHIDIPDGKAVIMEHRPSVRIHGEYFNKVRSMLLQKKKIIKRGIRIMVVGPVYGGSLPVARYCAYSLKKMGHTVEFVDNSRFSDALDYILDIAGSRAEYITLTDKLTSFLSETVLARADRFNPDLVFTLAQAPLTSESVLRLKERNIPTAYWFVEDFRLMSYWKQVANVFDYFFTIQKDDLFNELKSAGIRNYHYLPMAASVNDHRPVELDETDIACYGSDISFVGAGYYNRRHFLKGLLDYDFKIWGTDWDMDSALARCVQRSGARIETGEIVKIFNASKININLHSSTYHRDINPFGDFVNPRTFEIAASGGFQLVDRRSCIEELLKEDEEIVFFDDLDDLRKKINHYLENPEEREGITGNARKRIIENHSYEKRMEEMLDFIVERGFTVSVRDKSDSNIDSLIAKAGEESELGTFLSEYREEGRLSLDNIICDINEGDGDISKVESIFLLMNEFRT